MSSNLTTPSPSKKSNKDASSTGKRKTRPTTTETPPDIIITGNLVESELVPLAASKARYPGGDDVVVVVHGADGATPSTTPSTTLGYTIFMQAIITSCAGLRDEIASIRGEVVDLRDEVADLRPVISASQVRIQQLEDKVGRPIGRSW
jgi:hypothetical protein